MAENLYDIPTARKRTGREVFGDIREGFAAGVFGREPRFSRERRQEQLTRATLQDAQELQRDLAGNNQRQAIERLVDRANLLEQMGEDASDTYALRDMIIQGNPQRALSEVNTFLDAAKRQGLISAPAPIESKYITTDPSGRIGTVMPDASGGYVFKEAAGAGAPTPPKPETYTGADDIQRYATGPYAGYSVGAIADMMRTGRIAQFGDPVPSAPQAEQVRPPLRMQQPAPDSYAGLSAQEAAILRAEQEQTRLERERAAAEEARRAAEEERRTAQETRAAQAAEREQREADERQSMVQNEAMMALGLLRGRLLNPAVYSEKVYKAATGPIEGSAEGASWTTYLPFGASPQQVQSFADDFDNLNSLLTMGNLGRMTGVLSESDIRLIRDAASGLKRTSDPALLRARMIEIERILSNRLKEKFDMTDEEIDAALPTFSTGQGGAFDALINAGFGVSG